MSVNEVPAGGVAQAQIKIPVKANLDFVKNPFTLSDLFTHLKSDLVALKKRYSESNQPGDTDIAKGLEKYETAIDHIVAGVEKISTKDSVGRFTGIDTKLARSDWNDWKGKIKKPGIEKSTLIKDSPDLYKGIMMLDDARESPQSISNWLPTIENDAEAQFAKLYKQYVDALTKNMNNLTLNLGFPLESTAKLFLSGKVKVWSETLEKRLKDYKVKKEEEIEAKIEEERIKREGPDPLAIIISRLQNDVKEREEQTVKLDAEIKELQETIDKSNIVETKADTQGGVFTTLKSMASSVASTIGSVATSVVSPVVRKIRSVVYSDTTPSLEEQLKQKKQEREELNSIGIIRELIKKIEQYSSAAKECLTANSPEEFAEKYGKLAPLLKEAQKDIEDIFLKIDQNNKWDAKYHSEYFVILQERMEKRYKQVKLQGFTKFHKQFHKFLEKASVAGENNTSNSYKKIKKITATDPPTLLQERWQKNNLNFLQAIIDDIYKNIKAIPNPPTRSAEIDTINNQSAIFKGALEYFQKELVPGESTMGRKKFQIMLQQYKDQNAELFALLPKNENTDAAFLNFMQEKLRTEPEKYGKFTLAKKLQNKKKEEKLRNDTPRAEAPKVARNEPQKELQKDPTKPAPLVLTQFQQHQSSLNQEEQEQEQKRKREIQRAASPSTGLDIPEGEVAVPKPPASPKAG